MYSIRKGLPRILVFQDPLAIYCINADKFWHSTSLFKPGLLGLNVVVGQGSSLNLQLFVKLVVAI